MPAHGDISHVGIPPGITQYGTDNPRAWHTFRCGHCGEHGSGAVIARVDEGGVTETSLWLRCTSCGAGTVWNRGFGYDPGTRFGPEIAGLPPDVAEAYAEARRCMSVNAFTATELLCRKILMHVAADKDAGEGKTFAEYIAHLEKEGYITPPMKPWVDRIRQHGNEATHELPATHQQRAEDTVMFTAELLRVTYEMEHLVAKYTEADGQEGELPNTSAPS